VTPFDDSKGRPVKRPGAETAGPGRPPDASLHGGLGEVVSADDPGPGVDGPTARREEVLPAGLSVGLGVLDGQGEGEMHPAEAVAEVGFVEGAHVLDLAAEPFDRGRRQDRGPVLPALAVAHHDRGLVEVDILDAQPQALHQPEARSVHHAGGEPGGPSSRARTARASSRPNTMGRRSGDLARDDPIIEPVQRSPQDDLVNEEQGAEGLVLGGGRHVALDRQVRQESATSGSPISGGCLLLWNRMNLFAQET
jgi:hypothetical protein